MNKVNPTSCVATSNQNINIPDDQGRNIVLYFYPKDDTPGCTIEGNDFTRLNDSFAENNSVIYGVSRDSIASHEKFIKKFDYTIDLISDEDGTWDRYKPRFKINSSISKYKWFESKDLYFFYMYQCRSFQIR